MGQSADILVLTDVTRAQAHKSRDWGRRRAWFAVTVAMCLLMTIAEGQTPPTASPKKSGKGTAGETLHKQLDGDRPRNWVEDDVSYIITPEERAAWDKLTNDQERDTFIDQFWMRRDPTPDTIENEYRDEHYRRIVYSNEQFAWDIPGWKTDRGRIYITFGPPDTIDRSEINKENWSYRYLEGVGQQVELPFVDGCGCGDYRLQLEPAARNKVFHPDSVHVFDDDRRGGSRAASTTGDSLTQYIVGIRPPQVRFKDLEEVETHRIRFSQFPVSVSVNAVRATPMTTALVMAFAFNNRDMTSPAKDGTRGLRADVFARFIRLDGRIELTFERTFESHVAEKDWPEAVGRESSYGQMIYLPAGRYRMDVAVGDSERTHVGTFSEGIVVPAFDEHVFSISTAILAQQVRPRTNPVEPLSVGANQIVPQIPPIPLPSTTGNGELIFKRDATIHTWFQVNGVSVDAQTHRAKMSVAYEISAASGKQVYEAAEASEHVGTQLTLQHAFAVAELQPGRYQIHIRVTDQIAHKRVTTTRAFAVE